MESLTHLFYEGQKRLLAHYIEIEPLPQYPVDLSAKVNQKLMRDFFFRTTEELVESYHELIETLGYISTNNPNEASIHAELLLLELADVHHFVMEILIYSGLEPEFLHLAFVNYMGANNIESSFKSRDVFTDLYEVSKEQVNSAFASREYSLTQCFQVNLPTHSKLPIKTIRLNSARVLAIQVEMWDMVNWIMMASNCLKSKAWVQGERESNIMLYQERILKATITWFNILYMISMAPMEDLYNLYMCKNNINYERIQQKY